MTDIESLEGRYHGLRIDMESVLRRMMDLEHQTKNDIEGLRVNIHRAFNRIVALEKHNEVVAKDFGGFNVRLELARIHKSFADVYQRIQAHDDKFEQPIACATPDKCVNEPKTFACTKIYNRFRASGSKVGDKATHYYIEDIGYPHSWQRRISVWGYDTRLRDRIIKLLNMYGFKD